MLSDLVSNQGLCHYQPNNSTHDFSRGSGRNGCLVMALVRGAGVHIIVYCVWCQQHKCRMMSYFSQELLPEVPGTGRGGSQSSCR